MRVKNDDLTVVTSVTLPEGLKHWAVDYAKESKRSLSNLVTCVLDKERKRSEKPKRKS